MFPVMTSETLDELHAAIHARPQWQWEIDGRFRFTKIAPSLLRMLGRPREGMLGKSIYASMQPDDASRIAHFFMTHPGEPVSRAVSRHVRLDGAIVTVQSDVVPLRDGRGVLLGYRGISQGVMDIDLTQSESLYRMAAVYNTAPVPLCMIGRDGRFLATNMAFCAMFGLPERVLVGSEVGQVLPGEDERVQRQLRMLDMGRTVPAREIRLRGRFYHVLTSPVHSQAGQVIGITAAMMDITDRRHAEQKLSDTNRQLEYHAKYDYLTELVNRRHVDEVLADEVHRAMHMGHPLSVLMLDVDFFKSYNDYYGHLVGDDSLRMVAAELKKTLRRYCDVVGRYGGEEFIAVMPGADAIGALTVADVILHAVRNINISHAKSPRGRITLSIGAATLDPALHESTHVDGRIALLRAADRALYIAKLSGRDTVYGVSTQDPIEKHRDRID